MGLLEVIKALLLNPSQLCPMQPGEGTAASDWKGLGEPPPPTKGTGANLTSTVVPYWDRH